MGKTYRTIFLATFLGAIPASASEISGASDVIGTIFTVNGADPIQKGNELTGMIGTAVFAGGGTSNCTFALGVCTLAGQFSVIVTPPNSQTSAADWTISNLSDLSILSVTLNGIYASTPPTGQVLTGFNPALAAGHPSYNGTGSPATACGPTTGVGGCLEATSTPGGTTTAQASVLYTNALHMAGQSVNSDLWGQITLTFNTNPFASGQTFQFKIDTDGYTSASADSTTPEPSTFGMAGLAMAALALRRRLWQKS